MASGLDSSNSVIKKRWCIGFPLTVQKAYRHNIEDKNIGILEGVH